MCEQSLICTLLIHLWVKIVSKCHVQILQIYYLQMQWSEVDRLFLEQEIKHKENKENRTSVKIKINKINYNVNTKLA